MGLYDGLDLQGSGSTAALARWLGAPIILVVNAQRITRSVAALVQGYQHFEPETYIAGVILNNVARGRHQAVMTQAIEHYCGIRGGRKLPRAESLAIPDRHLGLVPARKTRLWFRRLRPRRDAVSAGFDLEKVLEISNVKFRFKGRASVNLPASRRPVLALGWFEIGVHVLLPREPGSSAGGGAKLVFVDSLQDVPPAAGGRAVYRRGIPRSVCRPAGSQRQLAPPIYARRSRNSLPVYAECGGLMYLSRSNPLGARKTHEESGRRAACDVQMTEGPKGMDTATLQVVEPNPFFPPGNELRATNSIIQNWR